MKEYDIKHHNSRSFTFDGILTSHADVRNKALSQKTLATIGCTVLNKYDVASKKEYANDVVHMLAQFCANRKVKDKEELRNSMTVDFIPEDNVDVLDFVPLADVETNKKVLVNRETKELSTFDYDLWFDLLDKDEKLEVPGQLRLARLLYDPYDISTLTLIPFQNFEVVKVNLYRPPAWRKLEAPESTECPEVINEFLDHLVPDEACKDYILSWFRNALLNRNEVYLVLNGSKGIGKGLLVQLLSMLVGLDNFNEAPQEILNGQFNSALADKRVISFDEFVVNKKAHSKLKRYINKLQNLEAKGKDADKLDEIFNSYVISNNDLTDMYIEGDDRRFSVPDLTTVNLEDVWESEAITRFANMIENDIVMAQEFGHFLLNYEPDEDYTPFSIWKGERFFELAYNSLSEWRKFFVDMILSGLTNSEIDIKKAEKDYKKDNARAAFPRNIGKIKDFFGNYRHEGKHYLGTVERIDGAWVVKVDPKYILNEEEIFEEEDIVEGDLDELL